ncbi:NTF2-like protein [Sarocladium strictum]
MSNPTLDQEVRASSDAAETFVGNYYQAVNNNNSLAPFYINVSNKYSAPADISVNGAVLPTPEDYQKLLEGQGHNVRYDVESLDAQVMNPSFQYGAPEHVQSNTGAQKTGQKMSIVVMVTGKVQFGRGKEAPQKMFNETFVLVPNWDALKKNPPRGIRKWLIMSQNFRAL